MPRWKTVVNGRFWGRLLTVPPLGYLIVKRVQRHVATEHVKCRGDPWHHLFWTNWTGKEYTSKSRLQGQNFFLSERRFVSFRMKVCRRHLLHITKTERLRTYKKRLVVFCKETGCRTGGIAQKRGCRVISRRDETLSYGNRHLWDEIYAFNGQPKPLWLSRLRNQCNALIPCSPTNAAFASLCNPLPCFFSKFILSYLPLYFPAVQLWRKSNSYFPSRVNFHLPDRSEVHCVSHEAWLTL